MARMAARRLDLLQAANRASPAGAPLMNTGWPVLILTSFVVFGNVWLVVLALAARDHTDREHD